MKIKTKRRDTAVSEIVGAVLLLAIAIAVFSVIYMNVLSDEGPNPETFATIVGKIEAEDLVFEHRSGETLDLDSKVILTVGGERQPPKTLSELLDQSSQQDGVWNIGERLVWSLQNLGIGPEEHVRVEGEVFDKESNSLVFWGMLQDGYTVPAFGRGGLWHFDEPIWMGAADEVKDSSGNNNHGISQNGARLVQIDGDPLDNNEENVMSGNSGFFDGTNDFILVESQYSLTIQDEITVEAWMKPLNSRYMRTTSGFDAQFGFNPDAIHVSGDIYAIVADGKTHGDSAGAAIAATVIIKEDGTVEEIIDEDNPLIFDNPGTAPDLVKLSEDDEWVYYAIVYTGGAPDYSGFLKIIKICKADGILDGLFAEMPKYTFDTTGCWVEILDVDNDIFVIVYSDKEKDWEDGNLFVQTVSIDANTGTVNSLSTIPIDSASNIPDIIKVTDTIYAIAYRKNDEGYISTVEIDSITGVITFLESVQFDPVANCPDLIHISILGDVYVYAVSYEGADEAGNEAGFVATFTIDSVDGSITLTNVDTEFDPESSYDSDIIHIQDDLYAIVYSTGSKGNPGGRITKLCISPDGMLINNIELVVDTFYDYFYHSKLDGAYVCYTPTFVRVSEYIFAVAYRSGIPHKGLISTFKLIEDPTPPYQRGVFKSGAVNLYVNQEAAYASIKLVDQDTKVETEYQLHCGGIVADNWYHIALTYEGSTIALYCHNEQGILVDSVILPVTGTNKIKAIGTGDYMFGHLFFGYLDEIAIQEHALPLTTPTGMMSIQAHASNPGSFENEI